MLKSATFSYKKDETEELIDKMFWQGCKNYLETINTQIQNSRKNIAGICYVKRKIRLWLSKRYVCTVAEQGSRI